MMNSRAASSWHYIVPIRVLNPLAEKEPPSFPDKVVKFWRIQRPRNQHQEESNSLSESQSTLEEAG